MSCTPTGTNSTFNENDNEHMLSLSTISALTDSAPTVNTANNDLENALVLNLARGNSVQCMQNDVSGSVYSFASKSFYASEIEADMRNVFDITTNAPHDEHFVVSSKFLPPSDKSYYDVSYSNVGNGINKVVKVIDPTLSMYDSHIDLSTNENYGLFYDSSNAAVQSFSAMFDSTQSTNNILRAINSHTNNSDHQSFLSVAEDVDFNTNYALGVSKGSFYIADTTTGKVLPQALNISNDLSNNTYQYSVNPSLYTVASSSGMYKIESSPDYTGTEVTLGNGQVSAITDLSRTYLPLFNEADGSGNRPMPGSNLSLDSFNSLFSFADISGILPNYRFDVSAVQNPNSGFSVDADRLVTDNSSNIFSLDSSKLVDNLPYMTGFVNLHHDLSFNAATLSINTNNSAASEDNINEYFSLNATREKLLQSTFHDGQIILNNRTPESRTETISQTQSKLATHVYYNNEGPVAGISNDLMVNQYVEYDSTLLFKNPEYSTNAHYSSSNNSYLDLFNNESLVNDRFDSSNIIFNSALSANGYDHDSLHIFKISPHQKLIAINGVIDTANSAEVSNYSVSANILNIPQVLPSNTDTLNKLEAILNLKDVSNLSIYNDARVGGWVLANSPAVSHGRVTTTTASAYRSQTSVTSWPSQVAVRNVLTGINSKVFYSIDLSSNTYVDTATNTLHQYFYIIVDWGYSANNLNTRLIINDDDLRRTANCTNNQPVRTDISGGIQVQTTDDMQFNFDLQLLPFDDLQLTTPVFTSTTTYAMKPNVMQYSGDEFIIDSSVSPVHLLVAQFGSSSVVGSLDSADLSELSVYVQSLNDFSGNTVLTSTYNISAFYHVPITMELLSEDQSALGDITFSLLPLTYCALTSNAEYRVNLVSEADPISYTIQYFTSQYTGNNGLFSDISNSLSSSVVIDSTNGYSALTWNNTSHTVAVSHSGNNNSNTVLSVSNGSANVFTLTIPGYKYLNTTAFITHCNKDIYRVRKSIGGSSASATTTTTYVGTKYNTLNGYNSYASGHVRLDSGVLLVGYSGGLDFATIPSTGYAFKFSLKPDTISVNMVGNANETLNDITNLTYQYVNSTQYSRILTVDNYRGYYGAIGQNQLYTLQRDQSVATLRIKSSNGIVAQQSFNVYAETLVTVNNLVKTVGGNLGDIGLIITFTSSMLASDDVYRFDVFSKGDDISITIVNPSNTSFVPVVLTSTMKTFQQYTFSGSNFIDTNSPTQTNAPLSINIGRLKMKNSQFLHESFVYTIYKLPGTTTVHKNNLYLGNPANVTSWTTLQTFSNDSIYGNNNAETLSHISFWRPVNKNHNPSVTYLVVAPPHLVFTQMSNSPAIGSLPFNTSDNSGNIVYSYLPVHDTIQIYNPYLTRNINYATPTGSFTITYDNTTNNVTISKLSNKTPYLYNTSSSSEINRFIIYGNHYTIKLYLGMPNAQTPILIKQLYSGIADDMITSSQELTVKSYDYSTGDAVFTFLQPLLNDVGRYINLNTVYGSSAAIYSAIYADSEELPKSIAMQLNSFFLLNFGDNGPNNGPKSAKIDLPLLQGIQVNLYTRNVVVKPDGNVNVHVYKYTPLFNLNPLSHADQVNTIYFTQREYKILSVPSISVHASNIPSWSGLLASIESVPSSWISDTDFNFTTFVSLVNYNTSAKDDIYTVIFGCENNGAMKATYITKDPILTLTNKVGMPIFQITAEGAVKTPLLCTTGISLMPLTANIAINNSLQNLTLVTTDAYETSASASLVNV